MEREASELGHKGPASDVVQVTLTPLGAFACGALLVAALAMAYALGGRTWRPVAPAAADEPTTLREARSLPPIEFSELRVDSGVVKQ